ncbi:MAG: class I lanthipeptide [Thermoanaerobaculia bacterium]
MKKRTPKRLALSRETLAHLDGTRLAGVAGGDTCNASRSCPPPSTNYCSDTCPTALEIC